MSDKTLRALSLVLLLLVLLYFGNALGQYASKLLLKHGYGIVAISCMFAVIFISFTHIKSIYRAALIAFTLYLSWGVMLQSTPVSDFSHLYNGAINTSETWELKDLNDSKSTTTTIYYAVFIYIFGKGYLTAYLASSFAWILGCILIYKSLINYKFNENHAKLAFIITTFAPSTIFYAPVVSTESVFFLLASLALYYSSQYYCFKNVYKLSLASLALGLLFVTRTNGFIFYVSFIVLIAYFVRLQGEVKLAQIASYSVIPFVGILLLQGLLSYSATGKFSVVASPWGAYNFLTGTSKDRGGGYSVKQLELAGFTGENSVSHEEASKRALQIATDRVLSDPVGFLSFALNEKTRRLWDGEGYSIWWSLAKSPKYKDLESSGTNEFLRRLANGYFMLMTALFIAWLIIKRNSIEWGLFCLPLAGLAFLHIFIEVQPRYHIPFMPFIYIGAAGTLTMLRGRVDANKQSQ